MSTESPLPNPNPDDISVGTAVDFALTERSRRIVAVGLVLIAVAHVLFPALAIDAIFLGLLAFAGLVLYFDIDRIEWLGIKAKRRALIAATKSVKALHIPEAPIAPTLPSPTEPVAEITTSVTDEDPDEYGLNPPVDRVKRLLWGAEQIRIQLVLIAGNAGHLPKPQRPFERYPTAALTRLLFREKILPEELLGPIRAVSEQRNRIAHAVPGAVGTVDESSDLAMQVLIKLREIRTNFIRVLYPRVELFADEGLTQMHEASPGCMIEQLDHNGASLHVQVFPTRATYRTHDFVSWEWNMKSVALQDAWYRDPHSGEVKHAFSQSTDFAGRPYPASWQVKYLLPGPMIIE